MSILEMYDRGEDFELALFLAAQTLRDLSVDHCYKDETIEKIIAEVLGRNEFQVERNPKDFPQFYSAWRQVRAILDADHYFPEKKELELPF